MAPPIALVPVDTSILSCYGKKGVGGPRADLTPLYSLGKAGICVPEVGVALKALNDAAILAGADFRVTELHRDLAVQTAARVKYETWVAAGKPTGASFNPKTMKAAFVALPGRSGHNAGRSIDVDLASLKFPGVPANLQLDTLWEIATPLGWSHIIKEAKEGASESWHFDYHGELAGVMKRLGYEQWALCGAILVGHGDLSGYDPILQALLCRAGYDIGKIDGVIGAKTVAALKAALPGVDVATALKKEDESVFAKLLLLKAA
jgi:hypothetical protein